MSAAFNNAKLLVRADADKEVDYEKLDPGTKESWVQALRSGRYRQGHNRLFNIGPSTYCCLGVLANEAGRLSDDGYCGDNPFALVGWMDPRAMNLLVRMNDVGGYSFRGIADWIEENL